MHVLAITVTRGESLTKRKILGRKYIIPFRSRHYALYYQQNVIIPKLGSNYQYERLMAALVWSDIYWHVEIHLQPSSKRFVNLLEVIYWFWSNFFYYSYSCSLFRVNFILSNVVEEDTKQFWSRCQVVLPERSRHNSTT